MANRRWLLLLATAGAALLYGRRARGSLRRAWANWRTFSMPSVGCYDALSGSALGPFYARVAREAAAACPAGSALDVGCGPGRLALRLAREAPHLAIVGVDVSPEMVALAARRAATSGLADRVRFQVGDAGALPFPDGQFDLVVSTLSMHHWPDPDRGVAEIHRVLKPGGRALIYDAPAWLVRATHDGRELAASTAARLFGDGARETPWKLGPVPVLRRLSLARQATPLEPSLQGEGV